MVGHIHPREAAGGCSKGSQERDIGPTQGRWPHYHGKDILELLGGKAVRDISRFATPGLPDLELPTVDQITHG